MGRDVGVEGTAWQEHRGGKIKYPYEVRGEGWRRQASKGGMVWIGGEDR